MLEMFQSPAKCHFGYTHLVSKGIHVQLRRHQNDGLHGRSSWHMPRVGMTRPLRLGDSAPQSFQASHIPPQAQEHEALGDVNSAPLAMPAGRLDVSGDIPYATSEIRGSAALPQGIQRVGVPPPRRVPPWFLPTTPVV